jgi:hypothetical protein
VAGAAAGRDLVWFSAGAAAAGIAPPNSESEMKQAAIFDLGETVTRISFSAVIKSSASTRRA